MTRRYPIAPLARLMHCGENAAMERLGVSGTTSKQYRAEGVSRRVADRLAVNAGYHPSEVWPEITDHDIEDVSITCVECGGSFVPVRKGHRYCTRPCQERAGERRRYRTDSAKRERKLEKMRRYRDECRDYIRAQDRLYRMKNKNNAQEEGAYIGHKDAKKETQEAGFPQNPQAEPQAHTGCAPSTPQALRQTMGARTTTVKLRNGAA